MNNNDKRQSYYFGFSHSIRIQLIVLSKMNYMTFGIVCYGVRLVCV